MSNLERDWEDFGFLTSLLNEGEVQYLENSDSIFQKIVDNYPIQSHRIDWDMIPHTEVYIGKKYPDSIEDLDKAIQQIVDMEKINPKTKVFICFDGYTSGALSMSVALFLKFASEILTFPQHTYVLPEGENWCLNYTMEHYLYFGYKSVGGSVQG